MCAETCERRLGNRQRDVKSRKKKNNAETLRPQRRSRKGKMATSRLGRGIRRIRRARRRKAAANLPQSKAPAGSQRYQERERWRRKVASTRKRREREWINFGSRAGRRCGEPSRSAGRRIRRCR